MSKHIRNFCIIAHIDHGKSTLADRMLELTWTIRKSEKTQVLDRMDIEQERGITIKLTPARMQWKDHELNLIDTPWHVDFQYEVSRSLASVEGAILLVDASQGVQAQTLSTLYMALDNWLEIIPVLNKIDLPAANPERVAAELENLIGIDQDSIIKVSGKTGENVDTLLDAIIEKIPAPEEFKQRANFKRYYKSSEVKEKVYATWMSRALIFDSVYDKYKWVVTYIKVVDGSFQVGKNYHLLYSENIIQPSEVGYFDPEYHKDKIVQSWQIWYIVTGQKSVRDAKIWDTIMAFEEKQLGFDIKTNRDQLKNFWIPWFKKVKPFVYAWVYPIDTEEYEKLKDAFDKLSLNDSAIEYDYENSKALGHWFRVGFLWTLHMDIVKERLFREYWVETIFTTPNVIYLVKLKITNFPKVKSWENVLELVKTWMYKTILEVNWIKFSPEELADMYDIEIINKYNDVLKDWMLVRAWADMPDPGFIDEIYEPYASVEVVWPNDYSWNIMDLCQSYRGELKKMDYIDDTRVLWNYNMPLWEIIIDFYDSLKSSTKGYATMNYDFKGYFWSDLVRLDVLINYEKVEAFSLVVHKDNSYHVWKELVTKLKDLIPKHLFPIPLQAWIWVKVIARETISAIKKDVLAKCYGWDITRKRKLLEKQKEWKKKLKQMWKVSVPSDIFIKMVAK